MTPTEGIGALTYTSNVGADSDSAGTGIVPKEGKLGPVGRGGSNNAMNGKANALAGGSGSSESPAHEQPVHQNATTTASKPNTNNNIPLQQPVDAYAHAAEVRQEPVRQQCFQNLQQTVGHQRSNNAVPNGSNAFIGQGGIEALANVGNKRARDDIPPATEVRDVEVGSSGGPSAFMPTAIATENLTQQQYEYIQQQEQEQLMRRHQLHMFEQQQQQRFIQRQQHAAAAAATGAMHPPTSPVAKRPRTESRSDALMNKMQEEFSLPSLEFVEMFGMSRTHFTSLGSGVSRAGPPIQLMGELVTRHEHLLVLVALYLRFLRGHGQTALEHKYQVPHDDFLSIVRQMATRLDKMMRDDQFRRRQGGSNKHQVSATLPDMRFLDPNFLCEAADQMESAFPAAATVHTSHAYTNHPTDHAQQTPSRLVGGIETLCIRVRKPHDAAAARLWNRAYKFHCLVLLCAVDALGRITYFYVVDDGEISNVALWSNCQLGQKVHAGVLDENLREANQQWKARFLGDNTTLGMSGVMQPNKILAPVFNELRKRSIPRLLLRWPILQKSLPNGVLTSRDAVITAIYLHNFCIDDDYFRHGQCKVTARGKPVVVDTTNKAIPHYVNIPFHAEDEGGDV